MLNKGKAWIVSGMVFGAWILAACSGAATATNGAADMPSALEEPTAAPASAMAPSVEVIDQDASSGEVTVPEVTSIGPGWMVIHATNADGKPGAILGKTHVSDGQTRNVRVAIDLSGATPQLFAMLHVDAGEADTFEFPNGPDVPAQAGDSIVNVPFQVMLPAAESSTDTLNLAESSLGPVLVDSQGKSLYLFTPDDQGASTCYGACADNWPPLLKSGEVTVTEGLDAGLVGTAARDDGSMQLTYGGWPLYYFALDSAPGDINGQGVNDVWYLLKADGTAALGGDGLPDY
jgi:predicted lipoprotein with Yx(FWY)xxD motif